MIHFPSFYPNAPSIKFWTKRRSVSYSQSILSIWPINNSHWSSKPFMLPLATTPFVLFFLPNQKPQSSFTLAMAGNKRAGEVPSNHPPELRRHLE
jgi:hypothetical protein